MRESESAEDKPQVEHSTLPWRLKVERDEYTIEGAKGEFIANNTTYYPSAPDDHDAAFIVKCVNVHDDLVSALEQALDRMEQVTGWAADGLVKAGHIPQMDAAMAHARKALEKARG